LRHVGWILDLYPKDGGMVVWLKRADGNCVRIVDAWKPRFYVGGDYDALLETATAFEASSRIVEKFEQPGDPVRARVLEIEAGSERKAVALAEQIQHRSPRVRLYNVDIPASQMYLYERDLFPFAFVEAETSGDRVFWNLRDSRERLAYRLPRLRKVSFEVKTRKEGRVRSFSDELDSVFVSLDNGESFSIGSGDEVGKILALVRLFQEEDPDVVSTKDGDSFVFPYLSRRAHELGILDELVLGRENSPVRVYEVEGHSYFSYGKILYRENAARLHGRLHIDENNAFITRDCGIEGLVEVSRTCIVPVQRASRATIGTNMTSLQFYQAVKQDVLIPWNKNKPEEWKDAGELADADRGGFVYEPSTGIYDDVGELDFSSLYPMTMLKENLSGETVGCECCPDSPLRVPELGYSICQRWQGIVPRSLDVLLRKRASYKSLRKEGLDPPLRDRVENCQGALKWILVCS